MTSPRGSAQSCPCASTCRGLPSDDLSGSAADAALTQADYHGVADPDDEGALAFLTLHRPTAAGRRAFARTW